MDVLAYARRINYHGSFEPTLETLRGLHRAHLMAVPFENLDIPLKRPIVLDEEQLFDKIVIRRRGGFCFELNGLFSALLREMGFNVQLLSARVANEQGGFGMEFDHLTLLVQLEERMLADVGFGDSFLEPLELDRRGELIQDRGRYRIVEDGDRLIYQQWEKTRWLPQYLFTLKPYTLADFAGACLHHQTSPESGFTQRSVCSLPTLKGRITLHNRTFLVTSTDSKQEQVVESESEYERILKERFGIVLLNAR